jgi:hypothetical protein
MNREHLVDRIAGNPAPASENAHGNKDAKNASAGNPAPARPRWLRNVNDYVRSLPREYQVMRRGGGRVPIVPARVSHLRAGVGMSPTKPGEGGRSPTSLSRAPAIFAASPQPSRRGVDFNELGEGADTDVGSRLCRAAAMTSRVISVGAAGCEARPIGRPPATPPHYRRRRFQARSQVAPSPSAWSRHQAGRSPPP